MKKTIAVIISVCILLSCFSYMCFAADDYTFYLIYSDVQANKKSEDQRYGNNCNSVSSHQLSYVTHSGEGEGLLFYGNVILPFVDHFPTDLELYRIMTTKLSEVAEAKAV